MERLLDDIEARVVGCLVEKDLATPEYYPLTLNALTNACNQKSNRDPVMLFEETDVIRALDSLRQKQLAHQSAEGVRAAKYCHNLEAVLNLDPEDLAILAELLLRGPQTVGELRNRAERMCPVGDLQAVEELLQNLMEREEPLVMRLPRQPGRKEHRFAHLLSGLPDIEESAALPTEPARLKVAAENDRIARLEEEVAALRAELDEVSNQLKAFQSQFE
ncbi:YceH family protein [Deltaproteobacteria bacterium IMCC39524]|nr:YceH family protein [Deltaproteobacteria bacterium IMCC39524]